jgi:aspartyl-tRNA(Asn)/glutamyl-tRNA(Gln) amidotransferase subunit A
MARTPADARLLLASLAGLDPDDPATEDRPLGDEDIAAGLEGLHIGLCPDLHLVQPAEDVQQAFDSAVRVLDDLGAELVQVDLPEAELAYSTFVTVQRAEALFTHTRAGLYPARREEYGDDVRGRLEAAEGVDIEEYLAASVDRQRLRAGFARVFRQVDLLITPVAAGSPLPIGEERLVHHGLELEFRELVMSYTVPQDLTGLPACTVRAGFDALGIPVGIQLTRPAVERSAGAAGGAGPVHGDAARAAALAGARADRRLVKRRFRARYRQVRKPAKEERWQRLPQG